MGYPKLHRRGNGVPRLMYLKNAVLISAGLTFTGGLAGYVVHDLVNEDPTPAITAFTCFPNGKNMTCFIPVPNMPSVDRTAQATTTTQAPAITSSADSATPSSDTGDERPMWPTSPEAWIFLGATTAFGAAAIGLCGFND